MLDDPALGNAIIDGPVQLRHRMSKRLQAITGGLLEIDSHNTVQFLHRTVADFLQTEQMSVFLAEKSHKDFTPYIALLRAALAISRPDTHPETKSIFYVDAAARRFSSRCTLDYLGYCFMDLMRWAKLAYLEDSSKSVHLLDRLQGVLPGVISSHLPRISREARTLAQYVPSWITSRFIEWDNDIVTVSPLMVRHSLLEGPASYLRSKLAHEPDYLRGRHYSPLLELVLELPLGHGTSQGSYAEQRPWSGSCSNLAMIRTSVVLRCSII